MFICMYLLMFCKRVLPEPGHQTVIVQVSQSASGTKRCWIISLIPSQHPRERPEGRSTSITTLILPVLLSVELYVAVTSHFLGQDVLSSVNTHVLLILKTFFHAEALYSKSYPK